MILTMDIVVELTVTSGEAELVADRLWSAGATAVGFRDGFRDGTTTLSASFPTDAAAYQVGAELGAEVVEVDPSWRDAWKEFAEPLSVGRLVVAPAWREVPVTDGLVLTIDPGGCFGSGSHASTRMLLAELDARPPTGLDVLDFGCGSGILSVAAARLGARSVTAVDIDPEALEVTEANASANGVSVCTSSRLTGRYDVALVNVTAAVHASVGPAVVSAVDGAVLLAGLLPGQWRHVAWLTPVRSSRRCWSSTAGRGSGSTWRAQRGDGRSLHPQRGARYGGPPDLRRLGGPSVPSMGV